MATLQQDIQQKTYKIIPLHLVKSLDKPCHPSKCGVTKESGICEFKDIRGSAPFDGWKIRGLIMKDLRNSPDIFKRKPIIEGYKCCRQKIDYKDLLDKIS